MIEKKPHKKKPAPPAQWHTGSHAWVNNWHQQEEQRRIRAEPIVTRLVGGPWQLEPAPAVSA